MSHLATTVESALAASGPPRCPECGLIVEIVWGRCAKKFRGWHGYQPPKVRTCSWRLTFFPQADTRDEAAAAIRAAFEAATDPASRTANPASRP